MIEQLESYLRPVDVEGLRKQFQSAEPFPFIAIDNFLQDDFVQEIVSSYPSVQEAESIGNTFHAVNESGKTQVTDANSFATAISRLNQEKLSHRLRGVVSNQKRSAIVPTTQTFMK